jgi:hypothetical protein
MKVALCFIISYEHELNKEEIWKRWINENKSLFNVYFYYKDYSKIKSEWIKSHCIPEKYIYETSYYHVIPAYISIINYALNTDSKNQWFCLLTDSCCPIISPKRFKYLFYKHYTKSIFNWRKAWWNVEYHKRANLRLLPEELRLANDPWFVLKREDALSCLYYYNKNHAVVKTVCEGGLANESLFAIMMYSFNKLTKQHIIGMASHAADWSRMHNSTSPHIFMDANQKDLDFIEKIRKENKCVLFIRKISTEFPDEILERYIYDYSKESDDKLLLRNPFFAKRCMSWVIFIIPLLAVFHLCFIIYFIF